MKKPLRSYQVEHINRLYRILINSNYNEAALVSAVGTGKSVVIAILVTLIKMLGKKVIITAPFTTIVNSFKDYSGGEWASGNINNAQYLISGITKTEKIKDICDFISGNVSGIYVTSHHAMANKRVKELIENTEDFSDLVLVIDEAHHCYQSDEEEENKDGTILGLVANYIKERGGKLLYVTATPYRTVGNQTYLIFDPDKCPSVNRTIGEHMRDGYAPSLKPEYIYVPDVKLINAGDSGIFGDLTKTTINNKQLNTLLPYISKQWKSEKYPKTLLLVPAGNIEHTAQEVKSYFEGLNFPKDIAATRGRKHPSVLISIGSSNTEIEYNNEKISELEYDKKCNGRVYDIVIGCRKFDEGTDVPSASHMFMIGLPSSVRLFHQRTGRVMRDKKAIIGYDEWFGNEWKNHSKVVFFAPIGKKTTNFEYKVGKQLLLCMFAAESYQKYCDSLNTSQSIRIAFEDKFKKAKTEANRIEIEKAMQLISNIELHELKDYSDNELDQRVKEILNPNMTVGDRIQLIKQSPDMDDSEKTIALISLFNNLPESDKNTVNWNDVADRIIKSSKKKKYDGFEVFPTNLLSDEIEDILKEFHDVKITINNNNGINKVFTSLSGEDFSHWAEKFSQFMGEENGLMWINKICDWKDDHNGKSPWDNSIDNYEQKLGRKLSTLKQAKNGNGNWKYYDSYQKLSEYRKYPDLLHFFNFEKGKEVVINKICDFYIQNGRPPSCSCKDKYEYDLGVELSSLKAAKQNKYGYRWSEKWQELVNNRNIPHLFALIDFKYNTIIKIKEIGDFYIKNGSYPANRSKNKKEKKLSNLRNNLIRGRIGKGTTKFYNIYKETADEIGCYDMFELTKSKENLIERRRNGILKISEFYHKYGNYPSGSSRDLEEKKLYNLIANIKYNKNNNTKKYYGFEEDLFNDLGCIDVFKIREFNKKHL